MEDSDTDNLDALRESRRQLATLLSNLPGMAYRAGIDPKWPMEFVSEGSLSLTGYRPESFIRGEPYYSELLDPDDREPVWRFVMAAIDRKHPFTLTYRITTASGHRRWVWEQGRAVFGKDGQAEAVEGFVTDITERRGAEERLRRSNRLYAVLSRINEIIVRVRQPQALLEEACRVAVEEGHFRVAWVALHGDGDDDCPKVAASFGDKDGLLDVAVNSKAFLLDEEGLVARAIALGRVQVVPNLELDSRPEPWREALLARGLRSAAAFPLLVAGRVKGSVNLYSELSPLDDEEIRLLKSLAADLSFALERAHEDQQRRRLQDDLMEARGVETVGRLAGTLAHDFNNILMIINACTDSLQRLCEPTGVGGKEIDQIQQACTRGSDLARRLLGFGRKQNTIVKRLDLGALVRNSQALLSKVLGDGVQLEVFVEEGQHPVLCDSAQVEQVLLNLSLNARDAMPGGGTLTVKVDTLEARHPKALEEVIAGPYVRLTLEDTGPGLSPEVRERMFEPFFTTKPSRAGSGLGLSIAAEMARRSGGWIHAPEDTGGKGARFEILLPKASA